MFVHGRFLNWSTISPARQSALSFGVSVVRFSDVLYLLIIVRRRSSSSVDIKDRTHKIYLFVKQSTNE